MEWKEKREITEELMDEIANFADAFENLLDALIEMEKINDRIYDVDVEFNDYLKAHQERTYNLNEKLIDRIKEAIYE